MLRPRYLFAVCLLFSQVTQVYSKEWSDKSGNYKFDATLIAFDDKIVVLKSTDKERMNGHDLISIPRKVLCEADLEYLASKEAAEMTAHLDKSQNWTTRDGAKVVGKIVDFVRKDVTIQRRRGNVYVNDRQYSNLPEIYRRIVLKVVEEFEKVKMADEKDLEKWVLTLRGNPKTFACEGVILEFENGDEYAIPFFLFSESDLKVIRPSWEQWSASKAEADEKKEHSLYLQSQASQYQQNLAMQNAIQQQMQVAQLQMLAVNAGVVDMWEVYMYPGPGVMGYPVNVVVYARDSSQAQFQAVANNPGYVLGPVRKLNRRR